MKNLFICAILVFLASCGGGSSSGGGTSTETSADQTSGNGGSGTQPTESGGGSGGETSSANPYAGVYKGTLKVTVVVKAPPLSKTQSIPVTITIDKDGKISGVAGSYKWSGKLDGKSFSHSISGSISESGITCSGKIKINGSVSGSSLKGTVSTSNLDCGPFDVTISGSLAAKK